MSYISDNLTTNEKVLVATKISWLHYTAYLLLFIACIAGSVALYLYNIEFTGIIVVATIGIFFLAIAWMQRHFTEFAVTNMRIVSKTGMISRNTNEINVSKLEGIQVNQGILGRIFNVGDVSISGTGGDDVVMKSIANPLVFRKAALEASQALKQVA